MNTVSDPYADIKFDAVPFKADDDTEAGTTLTISLTAVRQINGTKQNPDKIGIVLEGTDDTGTPREWVAWNRANKSQIGLTKPLVGETVSIEYLGRDPNADNPAMAARLYKLSVPSRGDANGSSRRAQTRGRLLRAPLLSTSSRM